MPPAEIGDLADLWAVGDCPPVQARLHVLVAKARGVAEQLGELTVFAADLERARAHLALPELACVPVVLGIYRVCQASTMLGWRRVDARTTSSAATRIC